MNYEEETSYEFICNFFANDHGRAFAKKLKLRKMVFDVLVLLISNSECIAFDEYFIR